MVRTQTYFQYDQINYLRHRALEEGITVAELLRRIVEDSRPNKKPRQNAGEWLLSMAKDAERRGVKGPKDLASNLDKYLYGG